MKKQIVKVDKAKYLKLVADQKFLKCLKKVGVENWHGYDKALAILPEKYSET